MEVGAIANLGASLSQARFETQFTAAVLSAQMDVLQDSGQNALRLIQAPAGSADIVLTFRNVHNWVNAGNDAAMLAAAFKALKPGGILGVVEHRAKPDTSMEVMKKSGYLTQDHVVALAEAAGFKLASSSEINANPKDTADHPKGVWSLPPGLRMGDKNRDHYIAIGESDRMTLKFFKP